jgi:uncharacterized protein (DUF433 family)
VSRDLADAEAAIVSTADTCDGLPRVAGTRITVATLDSYRRDGWTVEQTLAQHPSLTAEQVECAWRWAQINDIFGRRWVDEGRAAIAEVSATLEDIEVEAINDHGERVTAFPLTNVVSLRVEARPNEPVTVVLELTDVELDLDLQAEQMSVTAPARPE